MMCTSHKKIQSCDLHEWLDLQVADIAISLVANTMHSFSVYDSIKAAIEFAHKVTHQSHLLVVVGPTPSDSPVVHPSRHMSNLPLLLPSLPLLPSFTPLAYLSPTHPPTSPLPQPPLSFPPFPYRCSSSSTPPTPHQSPLQCF